MMLVSSFSVSPTLSQIQGRRESGDKRDASPPLRHFRAKIFFQLKLENIKFLHVNNMWDFSLIVEQNISGKK